MKFSSLSSMFNSLHFYNLFLSASASRPLKHRHSIAYALHHSAFRWIGVTRSSSHPIPVSSLDTRMIKVYCSHQTGTRNGVRTTYPFDTIPHVREQCESKSKEVSPNMACGVIRLPWRLRSEGRPASGTRQRCGLAYLAGSSSGWIYHATFLHSKFRGTIFVL